MFQLFLELQDVIFKAFNPVDKREIHIIDKGINYQNVEMRKNSVISNMQY